MGVILALGAIGLTLVYSILNFANFSHGDFLTFGAYIAFLINAYLKLNIVIAFIGSLIVTALVGVGLDKILWKRLRKKGAGLVTLLIVSIGVAIALRNTIVLFWGGSPSKFSLPVTMAYNIGGVTISQDQITAIIVAIVLMLLLNYLLKNTKIGKAMRALSDDIELARITGIDVDKVILWTWAIGMALAAAAGILYGLNSAIRPNMGWFLLLPIFSAVILGGIGNPYGAMAGGMVIGISQELSTAFLPSEYKIAVGFTVMIIVLLYKPEGIFGRL